MKFLSSLLAVFFLIPSVLAADRITLSIVITNTPALSDTLTVNGNIRTWTTNVTTPSTQFLIGAAIGAHTTNMWTGIVGTPYTGLTPQWIATNQVNLIGSVGGALTASSAGTWGTLTLSTQTVTTLQAVRVPITGEPTATVRTNIASLLVSNVFNLGLSTEKILPSSTVMENFVNTSTAQTIAGTKTFNANLNIHTNATVEYYLSDANFFTNSLLRFWEGSYLTFDTNVYVLDQHGNTNWAFSTIETTNKVTTLIEVTNKITALKAADNTWTGANTFNLITGSGVTNSTFTNNVFKGSANTWSGNIDFTRVNHTSLANGNNAGVDFGASTIYAKITPGPTAAFSIAGFTNTTNGRFLIVENATGHPLTILHNSGVDPTAANRIHTMSGADVSSSGNAVAQFVYDSEISRWKMVTWEIGGGTGTIINPTDGYTPYRVNGTTFGNSPWYRISTNALGFNGTNWFFHTSGGVNNVFAGDGAGDAVTTATDSTGMGNNALGQATSAIRNTAFGSGTLSSVITGGQNTAVGHQAGLSFTDFSGSFFGHGAGASATTAQSPALFGQAAGNALTTGARVTSVGAQSSFYNVAGADSFAGGYQAGAHATNISQSIIIGSQPLHGSERIDREYVNSIIVGYRSASLTNNVKGITNSIYIGSNLLPAENNIAVIGTNGVTVLYLNGTVGWFRGTGTPEAAVIAPIGSFYSREDGGAGTSFYVKESGTGNTGWVAK